MSRNDRTTTDNQEDGGIDFSLDDDSTSPVIVIDLNDSTVVSCDEYSDDKDDNIQTRLPNYNLV